MVKKGITFAFITAFISGISVFSNGLFVTQTDPLAFAFFRNAIVALLLTGILFLTGSSKQLFQLSKKSWLKLIAIGITGGGIPFALFFMGLSRVGSTNANIINKSLFLWVAVFALPFLKEKLHWIQLVGYGILFYALFFFGSTTKLNLSFGIILVLVASIVWGIEHVIAKKTIANTSPLIVSWARMVFGLPILGTVLFMTHTLNFFAYSSSLMVSLLMSSLLLVAYMITWYSAIQHAPVTLVSSILVLAPIITILLNSIKLGKILTIQQWSNVSMLIIGVLLIVLTFKIVSSRDPAQGGAWRSH